MEWSDQITRCWRWPWRQKNSAIFKHVSQTQLMIKNKIKAKNEMSNKICRLEFYCCFRLSLFFPITDVEIACVQMRAYTRLGWAKWRKQENKAQERKRPYTNNHFKWAFTNRVRVQKDILPIIQTNDDPLLWLKCYNLKRKKQQHASI